MSMGPPGTMGPSMSMGPPMTGMPPPSKSMGPPQTSMSMGPPPSMSMGPPSGPMPMPEKPGTYLPGPQAGGDWISNVARPQMSQVQNPPVTSGNIQYGPSYSMQYQKRSTADKTAVKYTGFLPLEGVYEEDTCRIG